MRKKRSRAPTKTGVLFIVAIFALSSIGVSYAHISETTTMYGSGTTYIGGSISGYVWFDVDVDGIMDSEEIGIKEYTVILYDSLNNQVDESTDNSGYYEFNHLIPDLYSLEITVIDPFYPTTSITISVTLGYGETVTDNNFGLNLDPNEIVPGGDCRSPGFWKTNLKKILGYQNGNHQVSEADMIEYCNAVYTLFFDEVFGSADAATDGDGLSLQEALDIINTKDSTANKLRRQLLAGELDYVSDDYQADDQEIFGYVLWYCEYILTNGISCEYETWKDILDSYWV